MDTLQRLTDQTFTVDTLQLQTDQTVPLDTLQSEADQKFTVGHPSLTPIRQFQWTPPASAHAV